jgi:oxygen-independent coproporphyrinogen-3 oxidase
VPFCHSQCTYCDFYRESYRDSLADAYLDALQVELGQLPSGFLPETIYVGGGTPSALKASQLARLLSLLQPLRQACAEYTFEVNPRSITEDKVELLASGGVDRISFGAQTFRDEALELLGRRHRGGDIASAFLRLRPRFRSVNFDLIFGLPAQTLSEWQADLGAAAALEPDHLSVYALTYEEGTPLTRALRSGAIRRAGEDLERDMLLEASRRLTALGYEHYEISSYARPGHRSLHNQSYWDQRDYFGVGPGAWSTLGSRRSANRRDLAAYVEGLLRRGAAPRDEEELSPRDRLNEQVMLRLRTAAGLPLTEFEAGAGADLAARARARWSPLIERGLLRLEDGKLRLTEEGLCVADSVIAELMD